MPRIKILVGDQLVDAEIVMHDGALYAKVPDAVMGSDMPALTMKLEAQVDAVSALLKVSELVQAAEKRFPTLYKKEGGEKRAKELLKDYLRCREEYESGNFDSAKSKLVELNNRVKHYMISMELSQVAKKDKKTVKKILIKGQGGQPKKGNDGKPLYIHKMAARFDTPRLFAKLYGADPTIPVVWPLDWKNVKVIPPKADGGAGGGGSNIDDAPGEPPWPGSGESQCGCCNPPVPEDGYVGWSDVVYWYDSNQNIINSCYDTSGSTAAFSLVTSCYYPNATGRKECDKERTWYYTS